MTDTEVTLGVNRKELNALLMKFLNVKNSFEGTPR